MDNTVRKLNIDNTDYKFPQGFPIIASYNVYGSTHVDLTQDFSLSFITSNFAFTDTFPRYTSTITAVEAKTELQKYRPLFFRWMWFDTDSSSEEHIITTELYPRDGNIQTFSSDVVITVIRNGVETSYIGHISVTFLGDTFSYHYIKTL